MHPSVRSHSNHTCTDHVPALTGLAPFVAHRFRGRLRPFLAGSPFADTESSSLTFFGLFGTALSLPAALHPTLLSRSCLPLSSVSCLPLSYDFHILGSWFRFRTRKSACGRFRSQASFLQGGGWAVRPRSMGTI